MAFSICYWANYTQGKTKLSRKSENGFWSFCMTRCLILSAMSSEIQEWSHKSRSRINNLYLLTRPINPIQISWKALLKFTQHCSDARSRLGNCLSAAICLLQCVWVTPCLRYPDLPPQRLQRDGSMSLIDGGVGLEFRRALFFGRRSNLQVQNSWNTNWNHFTHCIKNSSQSCLFLRRRSGLNFRRENGISGKKAE